jgi:endoplasmic reticulum junction formation protein lunapark
LTSLQKDIKQRQEFIHRLKSLNRSIQVHLVLFSSVFYGGYSLFLLLQYKFATSSASKTSSPSGLLFLLAFPFGVYYLKRGISAAFNSLISHRENVLKSKNAELKSRLEELKEETHYYKTKTLIEKYETTVEKDKEEPKRSANELVKVNKSASAVIKRSGSKTLIKEISVSHPRQLQKLHSPPPPPPPLSPPPIRSPTWMDRFMDALIGDDSRNQKFALICAQCFNHNGLATPESFEQIRYKCPNCGYFNVHQRRRINPIQEVKDEKIKVIEQEEQQEQAIEEESKSLKEE